MTSGARLDGIYRTRSLGVAAVGLPDQYADGKAAKVWELYIGSKQERTNAYKSWLVNLLRDHGVENVLDIACGTGVDSMMLVDEGFRVVSCDASDKMLKSALKDRWRRRKEEAYDKWVIEEANWLTLVEDLEEVEGRPEEGFDAVICMGNSFAHLPDFEGTQINQKQALANFHDVLKPGGILVIDHRNYDSILDLGVVPSGKNVYYQSDYVKDIKCSNMYVNGQPTMVTLDYEMDVSSLEKKMDTDLTGTCKFRLSYYPHRLKNITATLKNIFGEGCVHSIYNDFTPYDPDARPAYYLHVIQKNCNAPK